MSTSSIGFYDADCWCRWAYSNKKFMVNLMCNICNIRVKHRRPWNGTKKRHMKFLGFRVNTSRRRWQRQILYTFFPSYWVRFSFAQISNNNKLWHTISMCLMLGLFRFALENSSWKLIMSPSPSKIVQRCLGRLCAWAFMYMYIGKDNFHMCIKHHHRRAMIPIRPFSISHFDIRSHILRTTVVVVVRCLCHEFVWMWNFVVW